MLFWFYVSWCFRCITTTEDQATFSLHGSIGHVGYMLVGVATGTAERITGFTCVRYSIYGNESICIWTTVVSFRLSKASQAGSNI